jgi:hypothetical protein
MSFPFSIRILGWAIVLAGVVGGPIGCSPEETFQDPNWVIGFTIFGSCLSVGLLWVILGRLLEHVEQIADSLDDPLDEPLDNPFTDTSST